MRRSYTNWHSDKAIASGRRCVFDASALEPLLVSSNDQAFASPTYYRSNALTALCSHTHISTAVAIHDIESLALAGNFLGELDAHLPIHIAL